MPASRGRPDSPVAPAPSSARPAATCAAAIAIRRTPSTADARCRSTRSWPRSTAWRPRWAAAAIRDRSLAHKAEVLLSPVHGRLDPRELVAWMLRDRLPARLNLQIHKYIWGSHAEGV